ncbi:hypothetical protein OAD94_06730 [Amylibacter sp.]|nr:hypothetical protein [Amylibacter sp.]
MTTTFTAKAAEDDAFVEFRVLKPEIAIKAAVSAMNFCRDGGYQVGVAVVDRFGLTQAFVKSRYAGIGVSGAPGTDIDDECARAGIAAIEEDLLGF